MVVRNGASRYHLVMDAINNSKRTAARRGPAQAVVRGAAARHTEYIVEHLEDMPEVRDWIRQDPGIGVDRRAADGLRTSVTDPAPPGRTLRPAALADWTHEPNAARARA